MGHARRFGAVAGAVCALSGCGDDDTGPAREPAATPAPAAAVAEELAGDWTRKFSRREVETLGFPVGRYTLRIAEGTVEIYEGPKADVSQDCITQEYCAQVELSGSGRVLTLGPSGTCAEPGRYAFVVKGDTLTTRKVEDDCSAGRPLIFDGTTWQRAG